MSSASPTDATPLTFADRTAVPYGPPLPQQTTPGNAVSLWATSTLGATPSAIASADKSYYSTFPFVGDGDKNNQFSLVSTSSSSGGGGAGRGRGGRSKKERGGPKKPAGKKKK